MKLVQINLGLWKDSHLEGLLELYYTRALLHFCTQLPVYLNEIFQIRTEEAYPARLEETEGKMELLRLW